jgi:hypothetical protein
MNYVGRAVATAIVYGDVFSWPWSSVDSNYKKQIQHITVFTKLMYVHLSQNWKAKVKAAWSTAAHKVHLLIEIGTASVTPKS